MAGAMASGAKIQVGDVLGAAFGIWIKNIVPFTLIAAIVSAPAIAWIVVAPPELGSAQNERPMPQILLQVLQSGLAQLLPAALVYGVIQSLRGRPVGIAESAKRGFGQLLSVLGVGLALGVIVGALQFLPPLVASIANIFLSCILAVAVQAAVIENLGVVAAFSRSAALTSGNRWKIFLVMLVIGLLMGGIGMAFVPMLLRRDGQQTALLILVAIGAILIAPIMATAEAVIYQRLRNLKEGASIEDIAKVFD